MIKVSVIIPVYNGERYIRQTLDSVLAQTLKEIEVICVDDGSKDGSFAILKEYEEKDERVKAVTQENGGAGKARNTGLALARGEYLSFLDADDFFEPEMLEKGYEKAKAADADIIVWRCDRFLESQNLYQKVDWTLRMAELPPYRPMNYRNFTDNVFKIFVGWAWDKLFRKSFIDEYGLRYQQIRTSNDMLFVFTAIVLAKRIEVIDEILCHQRREDPNSLSNTREKSWNCFHEALIALKENLARFHLYEELEQDYINYALHFSLWHLDTITGEKKTVLYRALKEEWFKEFGIEGKPEAYFYNKTEYKKYLQIVKDEYPL